MKPIKLELFNSLGLICDVLDRLEGNFHDNAQWIQDCISEAKNRQENDGPTVPMTPKGRPKTRNYMKKRALQLELANRLNNSYKSGGSTPRLNRSVTSNAIPPYLNKSASIKSKLVAKAIKNSGKKPSNKPQITKICQPDQLRTALFKSPESKASKSVVSKAPLSAAASNATQEIASKDRLRKRLPKPKEQKVEIEKKPPARKGRPKQVAIANGLKNDLNGLANDLLNVNGLPVPKQIPNADKVLPSANVFKSPLGKLKIGSNQVLVKKPVTRKAIPENKPVAKIIIEDKEDECDSDSYCPEVCDKSLQVSFPSLIGKALGMKENLNPRVKLVDIGATLSNAIKTSTPQRLLGHEAKKSLSATDLGGKLTNKIHKILSSTPANSRPVVVLEVLDLTEISPGGFPQAGAFNGHDISYEILTPNELVQQPSFSVIPMVNPSPINVCANRSPPKLSSNVPKTVNAVALNIPAVEIKAAGCPVQASSSFLLPNVPSKPETAWPNVAKIGQKQVAPSMSKNESVYIISSTNATAIPPTCASSSVDVEEEVSSYDMTPVRKVKKFLPSTENDYNIRDIESDDSTDDECRPRKQIPLWARGENLRRALRKQESVKMEDVHSYFDSEVHENLDLHKIFPNSKRPHKLNKRTSSACWTATPMKKRRL